MKNKQIYRIKNWKEYNQALVNRGSLTLWFEEAQIEKWYHTEKATKRGSPTYYSDTAIQCGLVIREVFSLPLRATEGFLYFGLIWIFQIIQHSAAVNRLSMFKSPDVKRVRRCLLSLIQPA